MADWVSKLDDFLRLADREILTHGGMMSHDLANKKAEAGFHPVHKAAMQPTSTSRSVVCLIAQKKFERSKAKRGRFSKETIEVGGLRKEARQEICPQRAEGRMNSECGFR